MLVYMANSSTIGNIVAIILAIVGLVWLVHNIWRNYKINNINHWPKTNATIITSLAEPVGQGSNNQFVPKVVYSYTANGRTYISDNVVYSGSRSYNAVDTRKIMSQLTPNSSVPVYYNPKDPKESYIYNGNKTYSGIVIGIILLLIAAYLGYYHNKDKITTTITKKQRDGTTTKTTTTTKATPINLTDLESSTKAKTFYLKKMF